MVTADANRGGEAATLEKARAITRSLGTQPTQRDGGDVAVPSRLGEDDELADVLPLQQPRLGTAQLGERERLLQQRLQPPALDQLDKPCERLGRRVRDPVQLEV